MKKVLLTGAKGTVAQAMMHELADTYDMTGISLLRMDDVLQEVDKLEERTWIAQLQEYRARLMAQLNEALAGMDAVVHLGWNTRHDNCGGGLDPLNILQVDCVYEAAIEQQVPRIYQTSSVHSYDFYRELEVKGREPVQPFPDTREDPFGVPPTSLYGVSKRWMEIAGQYYVPKLHPGQKVLVVRLGALNRRDTPGRSERRLWNSWRDCAGLLQAFIECGDDAPPFWITFGISNNRNDEYPEILFDTVNPYGFVPQDNEAEHE